jgi:hypothetical protein
LFVPELACIATHPRLAVSQKARRCLAR